MKEGKIIEQQAEEIEFEFDSSIEEFLMSANVCSALVI